MRPADKQLLVLKTTAKGLGVSFFAVACVVPCGGFGELESGGVGGRGGRYIHASVLTTLV